MLKMFYTVPVAKKENEIRWLKAQGIYPACFDDIEWPKDFKEEIKHVTKFGIIVNNDAALAIKLRHSQVSQMEYRQK